MWVFLPFGFFSIVAYRDLDHPSGTYPNLLVRSRVKKDLESFIEHLPSTARERRTWDAEIPEILEGIGTDYPFRIVVQRKDVAEMFVRFLERDLKYFNFKQEAYRVMGVAREHIYMRVWTTMRELNPSIRLQKPKTLPEELSSYFDCPKCGSGINTRHGNGTRTCGTCGAEFRVKGH
jgi:hypothetical protein